MALANVPLGLVSLVLTAGAIVMMFFIILAGVSNVTPLNKTYFLSADTSGITGARDRSQWTYFYVCDPGNVHCSGAWPAPAFGWAWDGNPSNAPDGLVGSHGGDTTSTYYYYLWRFGWVLFLIGMFFTVIDFLMGWLGTCARLGSALAGFMTLVALFFYSIGAALITATFVKARNAFHSAGRDATVGKYAFGFLWGAWAALFLAMLFFCIGTRAGKKDNYGGGRRWGRKRSVRSRRSYDMGSHRIKDDYA